MKTTIKNRSSEPSSFLSYEEMKVNPGIYRPFRNGEPFSDPEIYIISLEDKTVLYRDERRLKKHDGTFNYEHYTFLLAPDHQLVISND